MPKEHVAATEAKLIPLLRKAGNLVFASFSNGEAIGIAICQRTISSWELSWNLNIHDLWTRDSHRGNGIGEGLIHFIENYAKDKGFYAVTLETQHKNQRARRLYRRLGYQGTNPRNPGAVIQMKRISPA